MKYLVFHNLLREILTSFMRTHVPFIFFFFLTFFFFFFDFFLIRYFLHLHFQCYPKSHAFLFYVTFLAKNRVQIEGRVRHFIDSLMVL